MEQLKEKYGISVAIAMVVGIVIGSGVFFKADDVLVATGGSLPLAILAWFIGGMIMVVSAYSFSIAARRVSKSNGIVDYVEAGYGKRAGFYTGFFMAYIYYPALTGVLAWVSALYTSILFGIEGYGLWGIALGYLLAIVVLNYLSPILSGKFQVSATVIKLIPLGLVAVVGLIVGLFNGTTVDNFTNTASVATSGGGLATAVLATAFAYEGWIVATSINGELKNAKKTLPRALVIGSLIVMAVYIFYYIGLAGTLENQVFADEGDNAVNLAVSTLFGTFAGTALTVFVIVSCLGTLNGLMLGTSRSLYSLALRGQAIKPEFFKEISSKNNAPKRAILFSVPLMLAWGTIWFGNFEGWFNGFLDISELPIAFLYAIYIAVYVWIMRTFKEGNTFERFVLPLLSTAGSFYIMFAAMQKDMFLIFVLITIGIFLLAATTEFLNTRRLKLQQDT